MIRVVIGKGHQLQSSARAGYVLYRALVIALVVIIVTIIDLLPEGIVVGNYSSVLCYSYLRSTIRTASVYGADVVTVFSAFLAVHTYVPSMSGVTMAILR
jgi:hypothetical protein